MQKIRTLLMSLSVFLFAGTLFFMPATASAALFSSAKQQACSGAALQSDGSCDPEPAVSALNNTLKVALNILSIVVAVIAVIMLIVGGIRFITSQGDGGSINAARNTIIYAMIGLVIAALAQAIVQFVINKIGV